MNLSPLEESAKDCIHQAMSGVREPSQLLATKAGSMTNSASRSVEVSTRGSSISGSGSGSLTTAGSGSNATFGSGSDSVSIFTA